MLVDTQLLEPEILEQVQGYILNQLPRVLEQDPQFRFFIKGIMVDYAPSRDEFSQLTDELREHRAETTRQFDDLGRRLARFQFEVNQHFGQVDQHLEQIDQHFEQVDKRFEQVDQRFEQVDQRFEQVDKRFEQVDQRFEQVDKRFEQVDQHFEQVEQHLGKIDQRLNGLETRVENGFHQVQVSIDRLGARWGIRNESIFRQTMKELLERSFGVRVEELDIDGEQFDCVIYDGQHILVEIAASVRKNIRERLERKRQLYIDHTGITPARFILAVGSIHSRRAEALRAAGFEVIEPEE